MPADDRVWVTECPRDAMQGLHAFIPTATKVAYINRLLQAGFDRLDFGSFVSPKAVPQMRDSREVLDALVVPDTTDLVAIVANLRGANEALASGRIRFIGYPFSVSETFQLRNTNTTLTDAADLVKVMMEAVSGTPSTLLVYLSMAFGNPYGDAWNPEVVARQIDMLHGLGVRHISLADTVGVATPADVSAVTRAAIQGFPDVEFGVHLHCKPGNWYDKVHAAFEAGCRHFDAAMKGYGGCPMAQDDLTGNLATENLVQYLKENNIQTRIIPDKFNESLAAASGIFMAAA